MRVPPCQRPCTLLSLTAFRSQIGQISDRTSPDAPGRALSAPTPRALRRRVPCGRLTAASPIPTRLRESCAARATIPTRGLAVPTSQPWPYRSCRRRPFRLGRPFDWAAPHEIAVRVADFAGPTAAELDLHRNGVASCSGDPRLHVSHRLGKLSANFLAHASSPRIRPSRGWGQRAFLPSAHCSRAPQQQRRQPPSNQPDRPGGPRPARLPRSPRQVALRARLPRSRFLPRSLSISPASSISRSSGTAVV